MIMCDERVELLVRNLGKSVERLALGLTAPKAGIENDEPKKVMEKARTRVFFM